jgi:CRISPR-associated endonuclease Cas1
MPDQSMPMRARVSPDPRVVVVDGYACTLCVKRGHVIVKTGKTESVISRLDAAKTRDGVARIIILSRAGTVSMEVMRWAAALDVAISQISRDGSVLFTSPGTMSSDGRIIRQQVLSGEGMPGENRGVTLTRKLLLAKLRGQSEIITGMFHADDPGFDRLIEKLSTAQTLNGMLGAEGNAANAYWRLWKERVFVPWEPSAMRYVPEHWIRFGNRSGITTTANGYWNHSNRNATDFVNACLNYSYKIAETEALYACHVMGLHPGIGVQHGTHDGESGMALDLLEALRPIVDRAVLSYLDYGDGIPLDDTGKPAQISKRSAYEADDGTCLLAAPMTGRLAAVVSLNVAPHAMRYAELALRTLAPDANTTMNAPKDMRVAERTARSGRLAEDATTADVLPDSVWDAVSPHVPVRHARGPSVDERAILAGIIAHEIYGASWPTVDTLGIDRRTCASRLKLWKETGAWDKIRAEVTRPGVSQTVDVAGV